MTELRDRIVEGLLDGGCVSVGVCGVEPLVEARRIIEQRRSAGLHGGMQFVYRNPARSTDPRRAFPSARSAVVAAIAYPTEVDTEPPVPSARVARYAAVELYEHLRTVLRAAAARLAESGHRSVVLADDNALVDRAMALRAGLGWLGKNTNLLVPGVGSWVVIGSLLTDADLPAHPGSDGGGGCGSCDRCLGSCPTGALVSPGVMDSSRCLSWLLQTDGGFPRAFRRALGNRIYGCDDCQEWCPPSRGGEPSGVAGALGGPGAWVSLDFLLSAPDSELMDRLGSWYIARRDPRYLRRNALVVLGNSGTGHEASTAAHLDRWLRCGDDLLVSHAAWAARALGREDLLAADDVAALPAVRAERAMAHPDQPTALAVTLRRRETGADVE